MKNTIENKIHKLATLGFTLIELLAVIVILAIIAVIAVPIVLNIINSTKESAVLRGANFYLDGLETSIATARIKNQQILDGIYSIMEDGNICLGTLKANTCNGDTLKVEMDGETPTKGTIEIKGGKIFDIELVLSEKTIIKNSAGDLIYKEAPTLASCEFLSGTEKTIGAKYSCDFGDGARNFYILELGSNKVEGSLLKSDEVALILEGNFDTTTSTWCDQSGSNPSNNVCKADGLTSKLNEISTAWKKLFVEQLVLPSALQIIVANNPSKNTIQYTSGIQTWLYKWNGYWTSSTVSDFYSCAWYVDSGGSVNFTSVSLGTNFGVRPVVNLKI